MAFDPYAVLSRALEREEALLWNLKELLIAVDSSGVGPASRIIPKWQLDRIEATIESSEEEIEMLTEALDSLDDEHFD